MELEYLTDGARHLICLPYSIKNLHEMANQLDVKTCWFHRDHYDIPKRRIAEIEAKCRMVSSREIVQIVRHFSEHLRELMLYVGSNPTVPTHQQSCLLSSTP